MRDLIDCQLDRFGISPRQGFLGNGTPLHRLTNSYYDPWESLIEDLPALVSNCQIRSQIRQLPVLDARHLKQEKEWQRAYVVLGFLTHAYIWGGETPSERLPPQISCPFLVVAEYLGLPLAATYSTLVSWNYRLKPGEHDLSDPDNLRSLVTITGSRDEEWFYLISVAVDARGASLIGTMLRCLQAVHDNDTTAILAHLNTVASGIVAVGALLERMHEWCDPQIFYHNIRPLLSGSKGMEAAGLKRGVLYDEGNGKGQWLQYRGGSNAQSSLIQLFDIFLEVNHYATGDESQNPKTANKSPSSNSFILEMRKYMPPGHRDFLTYVEQHNNLRDYVTRPETPTEIKQAYDNAVTSLVNLRNIHLRIVARYIVTPSRNPPAAYVKLNKSLNLATISSNPQDTGARTKTSEQGLHGTGGTMLMPFLKRTRDETKSAAIGVVS